MRKHCLFLICFLTISNFLYAGDPWINNNLDPNYSFTKVKFINSMTGFLIETFTLLKTTDGGKSWKELITVPMGENSLTNFEMFSDSSGLVIMGNGHIKKTTDFGESWTDSPLPLPYYFSSLCALDNKRFWLMSVTKKIFLYTSDGGKTWDSTKIDTDNISYLGGFYFINSLKGFSATDKGKILQTNDGGKNWIIKDVGVDKYLEIFYFLNEKDGWIAGLGGTIIHTINGGESWEKISFPTDESISSIWFINDKEGWVTTVKGSGFDAYGRIYYTSDQGANWIFQHQDTTGILSGISFIDQNNGWVCGFNGLFLLKNNRTSIINDNKNHILTEDQRVHFYSDKKSYPNPTSGIVKSTVYWNTANGIYKIGDAEINVYNIYGEKIINPLISIENLEYYKAKIVLDCSGFASGVYFINIILGGESISIPITVIHGS